MSQTWELEIAPTEIQVGDIPVSYKWGSTNGSQWSSAASNWVVTRIGPAPGECWYKDSFGEEHRLDDGAGFVKLWRVNRPKKEKVTRPATKADWPHPCPRCGRANSAIVLFSTVECKEGCYA